MSENKPTAESEDKLAELLLRLKQHYESQAEALTYSEATYKSLTNLAEASDFLYRVYSNAKEKLPLEPGEKWKTGVEALVSVLKKLEKCSEKGSRISAELTKQEVKFFSSSMQSTGVGASEKAWNRRRFVTTTGLAAGWAAVVSAVTGTMAYNQAQANEKGIPPVPDYAPTDPKKLRTLKTDNALLAILKAKLDMTDPNGIQSIDLGKWNRLTEQEQQIIRKIWPMAYKQSGKKRNTPSIYTPPVSDPSASDSPVANEDTALLKEKKIYNERIIVLNEVIALTKIIVAKTELIKADDEQGIDLDKWNSLTEQEQQILRETKLAKEPSGRGLGTVSALSATIAALAGLAAISRYKQGDSDTIKKFRPLLQDAVEAVAEVMSREEVRSEIKKASPAVALG